MRSEMDLMVSYIPNDILVYFSSTSCTNLIISSFTDLISSSVSSNLEFFDKKLSHVFLFLL